MIRTHTVEGHRMLDQVGGIMRAVGLVVGASYERWDGGGYPDGLAGEDIPVEARILSCCDTYSAPSPVAAPPLLGAAAPGAA